MARRKKPIITGHDPEYTSNFGSSFKPLPTNMPKASHAQSDEPEKVVLSTEPEKNIPLKPVAKPDPQKKPTETQSKSKAMKIVQLFATPKKSHEKAFIAVADLGIDAKDVIRLAGRKANSEFSPRPKYSAPQDVKRLNKEFRYLTSKNISTDILNSLHASEDPLNLKSDALMVQGQFEKLFWQKLDEVILELSSKFKD